MVLLVKRSLKYKKEICRISSSFHGSFRTSIVKNSDETSIVSTDQMTRFKSVVDARNTMTISPELLYVARYSTQSTNMEREREMDVVSEVVFTWIP